MKFDQHNIDDLFRDGLDDYAEQPSSGLWKKISGRLLWGDLAHFRFINVPKVWFGVAAAGLIVATLWFAIPATDDPENLADRQSTNESFTPADDGNKGSAAEVKITAIPEMTEEQALNTEESKHVGKIAAGETTSPESTSFADHGMAENSEPVSTDVIDAGQETIPVVPSNQTGGNVEKTKTPATKTPTETTAETSVAAVTNNSNATERKTDKMDAPVPGREQTPTADPIESREIATISGNENQAEVIPAIELQGSEGQFTDEFGGTMTTDEDGSGKIQKIHSLSFSVGQLFKGKYKPPKRDFQSPVISMYQGHKPYFSIAAYFAPELTEYTRIASKSKEKSYVGGLAVTYNSSSYLVQAGLEVSHFYDLGDYMVNMSTYDSVGFYIGVSGFEVDPENPDSIILQTHNVVVWDSVQHHSHQQTRNTYTYLQIPLMVGYKAMERGLFSAHIKAGPGFSFMLTQREPGLDFHMQGATITGIENYTAPRLNTSIQVLVSLAMQFQFTEKFGLLVEPTYRYYLNPVYDLNGEALKNPYGIGVRGGFFYNF